MKSARNNTDPPQCKLGAIPSVLPCWAPIMTAAAKPHILGVCDEENSVLPKELQGEKAFWACH